MITPDRQPPEDEDVIATVAAENHPNAVKLAQSDVISALPFFVLGAAALISGTLFRELRLIAIPGLIAMSWGLGRIVQYVRVVREDPVKRWRREIRENHEVSELRYDFELRSAAVKPRLTITVMVIVTVVTLVEFFSGGVRSAVPAAALVKPAVRSGEWWRLLTAAYLHGSLFHLLGNMSGLWTLGRVIEMYDAPSRIPLTFLISALGCSLASTMFLAAPSLGASGGVVGLVGYLLATAGARPGGTPDALRKSMGSMVASVLLTGIAGYSHIDNAGHAGGLVAGILLGLAVRKLWATGDHDRLLERAGQVSLAILIAGAVFTIARLVLR